MSVEAKEIRLERILSRLQRDVESGPSEALRVRRRLIMKGVRMTAWALVHAPCLPLDQFEAELRSELFSESVPRRHISEVK
ncbi:hypothetical protein [Pseudomonas nunensis]|uniref:Uncharacterized protein n=1 Tax=Pseudomonas nunensis TaxID=2961896 RepID=A0ABY5EMG9_9PSED|nr:hypothetical protein [Pseudomonas nunensis]MCL5228489.1 hypothetical protein [Pseudomonas nunensis]UTO16938.1 hypothetical protein NK667_11505 [Pseudomonas nunensis]